MEVTGLGGGGSLGEELYATQVMLRESPNRLVSRINRRGEESEKK